MNLLQFFRNRLFTCAFLLLFNAAGAQRVLVNSSSTLYEVNAGGNLCTSINTFNYCNSTSSNNYLFSIALFKDTLYFVARDSRLYRMKLGDMLSCREMTIFPINNPFNATMINSLAVSKNGILYGADGFSRELYEYNPYTGIRRLLGRLNVTPSGDMIFYKDKLILAAMDGSFYEVDPENPGNSTPFITGPAGKLFYGIFAVPFDCTKNKYYALEWVAGVESTRAYELDMENRSLLGEICQFPFYGYDAGSNVDDGSTLGVLIDSILVNPPCGNNRLATVKVKVISASTSLTYTMDGTLTNQTGYFPDLPEGTHTISVRNQLGCAKDSTFTIAHGLSPVIQFEKNKALNCNIHNGSIIVHAASGYLPLNFSISNGPWTTDSVFSNLPSGQYYIRIRDARGCEKDSTIVLGLQTIPDFLSGINISPAFCTNNNGGIGIQLAAGINPGDITASLDGRVLMPVTSFSGLNAGTYTMTVVYQGNCQIDTLITVPLQSNPAPDIQLVQTDQRCAAANGSVQINPTGSQGPYLISFNNAGPSASSSYSGLLPGYYPIRIADKDGCITDTSVTIKPYLTEAVMLDSTITNPTCRNPTGGQITLTISDSRMPYRFRIGNRTYPNGSTVSGLIEGRYPVTIYNGDDCLTDSSTVELLMPITPDCDMMWIPTGFTPNKDGLNDTFKPVSGPAIRNYQLRIYNRWGQLVFQTNDREKGWDGRVGGKLQNADVYAFTVRYNTSTDPVTRMQKGTMTLIR